MLYPFLDRGQNNLDKKFWTQKMVHSYLRPVLLNNVTIDVTFEWNIFFYYRGNLIMAIIIFSPKLRSLVNNSSLPNVQCEPKNVKQYTIILVLPKIIIQIWLKVESIWKLLTVFLLHFIPIKDILIILFYYRSRGESIF